MKRRELEKDVKDSHGIEPALAWAKHRMSQDIASGPLCLRIGKPRRTLDQNAKLWPMCQDVARQVQWCGAWLSKDDWKDLFTGSLKKGRPLLGIPVAGEQPGIVIVGGGSSKLSVREFCDLIEFIESFGVEHGVEWSKSSTESIAFAKDRAMKRGGERHE